MEKNIWYQAIEGIPNGVFLRLTKGAKKVDKINIKVDNKTLYLGIGR